MEITDDLLKLLVRMDNVGVIMRNRIDPTRQTDHRTDYYDGYASGVQAVADEIRRAVEIECPEFHERLAKLGQE